jgi:hypothetical protein
MSHQQYISFLDDEQPGRQPGDLGMREVWWAERQEALEAAGYMLRARYRPGWIPSWRGTDKSYLDVEDGPSIRVSAFHSFWYGAHKGLRCVWEWTLLESLMADLWY